MGEALKMGVIIKWQKRCCGILCHTRISCSFNWDVTARFFAWVFFFMLGRVIFLFFVCVSVTRTIWLPKSSRKTAEM